MKISVYGIKNCTTVKKALSWLESYKIDYLLWDYKTQGIDRDTLAKWCALWGWEKVLNRSGQMYRKASQETKDSIINQKTAIDFMLKVPTSIKRPILFEEEIQLIGFDPETYKQYFKK
ncbi:MAG: Spx/MgsR family RNA polymerase-binding regulatory protein [Patescibacteria group bacterium]